MKRIGLLLVLVSLTLFSVGCKQSADTAAPTDETTTEAATGDDASAEGEAATGDEADAPAEGEASE